MQYYNVCPASKQRVNTPKVGGARDATGGRIRHAVCPAGRTSRRDCSEVSGLAGLKRGEERAEREEPRGKSGEGRRSGEEATADGEERRRDKMDGTGREGQDRTQGEH